MEGEYRKVNNYIFFSEDGEKISDVYSGDEVLSRMSKLHLELEYTFSAKDLGKVNFDGVKYIFSTWSMPQLTTEQIKKYFPSLSAVFYAAGTVKYFAKPFFDCGIDVFSADYANAIAVSDFVFGEILLATKGFYQAQALYKRRRFSTARNCAMNHVGNYKATVGIIGVGKIGHEVINRLARHNFRILACDPVLTKEHAANIGCEKVELEDIFKQCDVISNHLPDINATKEILNYNLFMLMKDNSTFINTGRGRQVEESGLIKALSNNRTICAVLDVTSREPMLFTSKFYTMSNIFITPHIAGSTNQEQWRMADYMIDAYEAYISGKKTECCVNPGMINLMT